MEMKPMRLSLVVTSLLILPILGCAQDPKYHEIKTQIGQIKTDNDELIRRMRAGINASNDPAFKDLFAKGGEPGQVTLAGALVSQASGELKPVDQIKVEREAGVNWHGVRESLKEAGPILKSELSDKQKSSLADLKSDKYWINVGCPKLAHMPGRDDLELAEIDFKSPIVSAKAVIVCDLSLLTSSLISISAELVVFHEMKSSITGVVNPFVFVSASELQLDGLNVIHIDGSNSSITPLPGPSISLAAEKLSGLGTLEIVAHGGNYQIPPPATP
jgi:hypothetical protein